MQKHYLYVLVPSILDIEELIKQEEPNFKYSTDFFYYLVGLQIEIASRNKDLMNGHGFVPYHSKTLESINRNYRKHLDYLVKYEVLDEYRFFSEGKSRRFRISEKYLDKKVKEVEFADKRFIKKLNKTRKVKGGTSARYRYLLKWFTTKKLTIDDEAIDFAYDLFEKERYEMDYYKAYHRLYSKIYLIKCIQFGSFWFTRNGRTDKRLHTNLTNLNKEFRQFLKYDGESLSNIDMVNAQAFFTISVIQEVSLTNPPPTYYTTCTNTQYNIITFAENSEMPVNSDVQRYISLCLSGELYDYFAEKLLECFGKDYFSNKQVYDWAKEKWVSNITNPRDRAKITFFEVIFSKNTNYTKGKKLFKELFPTVMEIFENYKKEKHNLLALKLQNIESEVVLDLVCKQIQSINPDIPLFTIHDSISTTQKYVPLVKEVFHQVLFERVGFNAKLRVE